MEGFSSIGFYQNYNQIRMQSQSDKKQLIESMKNLAMHITNDPVRQSQIFGSLGRANLLKIINNFADENEYLRRISALLLCQLIYNCSQIKLEAAKILSVFPLQGRICLNAIPECITRYPSTLKRCIELMRAPIAKEQQEKMCWFINLDRKSLKLEYMDYRKYSSFTFIDPARNIIGYSLPTPQYQISPAPLKPAVVTNSPRNLLEQRFGKESAYSYIRPTSSRLGTAQTRKQDHQNSQEPKTNTSLDMRQSLNFDKSLNSVTKMRAQISTRDDRSEFSDSVMTERKKEGNRGNLQAEHLLSQRDNKPETSRNSSGHQNFYKRVKEILKR